MVYICNLYSCIQIVKCTRSASHKAKYLYILIIYTSTSHTVLNPSFRHAERRRKYGYPSSHHRTPPNPNPHQSNDNLLLSLFHTQDHARHNPHLNPRDHFRRQIPRPNPPITHNNDPYPSRSLAHVRSRTASPPRFFMHSGPVQQDERHTGCGGGLARPTTIPAGV